MSGKSKSEYGSEKDTPSGSTIAGVLSLLAAIIVSFGAVLTGEGLAYSQTTTPVIGGGLWPISAGLVIIFAIGAGLFVLMVIQGLIESLGVPELQNKTEYTILGIGGLTGTLIAGVVSAMTWLTGVDVLGSSMPAGSGESIFALAAVALPFTYIFHQLYKPDMTPINSGSSNQLDPEFVREKTERQTDMTVATPAKQREKTSPDKKHSPSHSSDSTQENTQESKNPQQNKEGQDWTDMEYRWQSETDVSFADVGGMNELKQEIREDVVMPLVENPEKAAELGVDAPNIIFHGPPGTGKTFMAKAMATELGLPFAQLSGADLQSKWINESASKVKTLFEEAITVAEAEGGAVVFLDELDSVLKDRSSGSGSHEEDKKVVNEFLNWLENTGEHNVVFIGATNRLDALDEAGIRSGRIDKKVHVGKPDTTARAEILKAQFEGRPHSVSQSEIKAAAEETDGFVASDIELVVKSAAKRVLIRGGEGITRSDLFDAIEEQSSP